MKRSMMVLVTALIAAFALMGAAATLGVESKKVDSFTADQAATTVPSAQPSSCGAGTPAPMTAGPTDLYVTTESDQLFQYSVNASTGAFGSLGSSSLNAANTDAAGVAGTSSFVYVVDNAAKVVHRYNLDRSYSSALSRTLNPGGMAVRGLAVDEANNELWIADRQGSSTRVRCWTLSSLGSGTGGVEAPRSIVVPNADAATPHALAMDATYVYVVDGASKRVYRVERSTGNITQGSAMGIGAHLPRGAELRDGALFVATDGKKIFRFPNVNAFFSAGAAVSPDPAAPADLTHDKATGL